jgi:serine/threonine-protein kinase/endoribonuclease IRE1
VGGGQWCVIGGDCTGVLGCWGAGVLGCWCCKMLPPPPGNGNTIIAATCWTHQRATCADATTLPAAPRRYFSSRFRNLLMTVFMFALKHLASDASLAKYWPEGLEACAPFAAMFQYHNPLDKASRAKLLAMGQGQVAKGSTPSKGSTPGKAIPRPASLQDVSMASPLPATSTWADGRQQQDQQATQPPPPPMPAPSPAPGDAYSAAGGQPPPPPPPATPQAAAPAAGSAAGASPGPFFPPPSELPGSSTGPIIVGYEIAEDQEPLQARQFPSRPGAQVCDFFQKTGHCRFGEGCIFDHPAYYAVLLTDVGLPYRPSEQLCTFYSKKGQCKFGPACKFHHPKLQPIYAGSGVQVELQGS